MNQDTEWYFATLLFEADDQLSKSPPARRCAFLLMAPSPDEALAKAQRIGRDREGKASLFLGVDELLAIDSAIQDGVELVWREESWDEKDLPRLMSEDQRKELLQDTRPGSSGWYVGEITLLEVVEPVRPDPGLLVWRNTYLLKEPTMKSAAERLTEMGQQEQETGEHRSDGRKANWSFKGVSKLVAVAETPDDGSLLWCDPLDTSTEDLKLNMPSRDELGVFRWLSTKQESSRGS